MKSALWHWLVGYEVKVTMTYFSRSSDFALYFEDSMIISQHDQTFDLKINIGHGEPVILPYILKTIWYENTILWDYESVWPLMYDLKINVGHCDLYFMVQWFCLISWILQWLDILFRIMSQYDPTSDLKIYVDLYLWPIIHGPRNLPYNLKTARCMNIILCDNESV